MVTGGHCEVTVRSQEVTVGHQGLVAVVTVLGKVHDAVVVVVCLGPVHYDLLPCAVPHYDALQ